MKQAALALLLVGSLSSVQAQDAKTILDVAGVQGGLIVLIGCENPDLLAGLRASDSCLVHGLEPDSGKVATARKHLLTKGLHGPVTVSQFQDSRLPYIDSLVNAIVLTGSDARVPRDEMMRVLAPGGALVDARDSELRVTRKARPEGLDEWPQYLYDASNNAVSRDTVVAPPRGLQWTCGPAYARSHEHFGSVSAMVSTAGRVFAIIDEGPISSVFLPPNWKLVARDAYSGVHLWERAIANWESQLRGFRSGPPEIGRRLLALGQHVYVTLGYGEPVTILDAATGEQRNVLAGTEGARELLLRDGALYVLADDMTAADHDARKKWINDRAPKLRGYQFPREPIPMYGKQRIIALDADSGKRLWQRSFAARGEILPATLAEGEGRVCFQTASHVVCLHSTSGDEAWRSARPVARSRFSWSTPTLVVQDGVVLSGDRLAEANADKQPPEQGTRWLMDNAHQSRKQDAEVVAFALKDGKELWRAPFFENYDTQIDIFVIDGVVWIGDLRHSRDAGFTQGRDLRTGKVVATIPHNRQLYGLQMGHHRCYRNRATVRWLLLGRDGIEFVDPKKGTGSGNWWVRGTCQYGVMPANGMVYAPQHSCACHPAEKLNGFNTLSARSAADDTPGQEDGRLAEGPAYGADTQPGPQNATDWPTYRRDSRRSGFQDVKAPVKPSVAWTTRLSTPLTAPVVAGGKVFVAETDQHALHALSERDGGNAWTFRAEGRIDSPPTIADGLCVFGTRNGFVYCLRAADGKLVWRFRAGPRQRLLMAYGQLESAWPVHGSVLVDSSLSGKTTVYFAAGRSSHVDGGIRLYALDLRTGKTLQHAVVTMSPKAEGASIVRERVLPDVMSVQRGSLFMRNLALDSKLAVQKKKTPHLYAPGGFLDDTWWHRTYWMYGTQMMSAYGGWPRAGNMVPAGRLLAFDGGETIYGYGRMSYRAGAGHVHADAAKGYKLFAEAVSPAPAPQPKAKGQPKKKRAPTRRRVIEWSVGLPLVARAVVLTQDALLAAGGATLTEDAERHGKGRFWTASREDGAKRAECALPAPPVLDGMACSGSGVFVSAVDGSITCLRDAR